MANTLYGPQIKRFHSLMWTLAQVRK